MHHVLVVEDSAETRLIIAQALRSGEIQLASAGSLEEARGLLADGAPFDLIVLDLALPDGNGLEFFVELQGAARTRDVPVIFLTGNEDVGSKVTAFSYGAEDYVSKPFSPLELKARVEARLRKRARPGGEPGTLDRGPIRLSVPAQRAWVVKDPAGGGAAGQRELALTPREFRLLYHLASHEDRVFSRQQLLDSVWGDGVHVTDRTVDTHVCSLRRKLGAQGALIVSVPGVGYRFTLQPPGKRRR